MYPDPFTTQRLAIEFQSYLKDCIIKEIFSTSKTELYFVFSNKKCFKIQFFNGTAYFLFPDIQTIPLKNRFQWFKNLYNSNICRVKTHPLSRSFEIEFGNSEVLLFKLFGKFSNVIHYNRSELPLESFCLNIKSDLQKPLAHYFKTTNPKSELETQLNSELSGFSDAKAFYLSLKSNTSINLELVEDYFFKQVNTGSASILNSGLDSYAFSVFPTNNQNLTAVTEPFADYLTALDQFTKLFIAAETFKNRKANQLHNIQAKIQAKQKQLKQLKISIEQIKKKRSWSEIGDLVMANVHSIHKGISNVELFDFYNNTKIKIKLNPDLSPQENASSFYKKSKNEVKELEFKFKTIELVENEIDKLQSELTSISNITTYRGFKKVTTITADNKQNAAVPYKSVSLGKYQLLIGKSAKGNDELLSKYSSKNDTWLHIKDLTGSHVLIKNPSGKALPEQLIHDAAALAGFYSKGKNQTLVPIMVAPRKFVRKQKGAAPGLVTVERSETIMVQPSSPEDILKRYS